MERKVQSPAPLAGEHMTGLQAEMEALGPGHTMGDVAAGGGTANSGGITMAITLKQELNCPMIMALDHRALSNNVPDQPKVVDNEGQATVGIAGGPGY